MSDYSENRSFSDAYTKRICGIVGPHLLTKAPYEIDTQQATDLVVIRSGKVAIAARVRRPGFIERYGYEFTIRSMHKNTSNTELQKIQQGFADWMFYGHASSKTDAVFDRWMLLGLDVFRRRLNRGGYAKGLAELGKFKVNRDGQTGLHAFDVRDFDREIIVDCSPDMVFPAVQFQLV